MPSNFPFMIEFARIICQDIAEELEIPRYVFFSNCALEARLRQAGHELQAKGKLRIVDGKAQGLEELVKVPGFEFMRVKDLPWFMWAHPEEYLAVGESLLGAEGVILNTFSELEDSVIRSFQNAWLGDPEVKVHKILSHKYLILTSDSSYTLNEH